MRTDEQVSTYRIQSRLGAGGMGEVYRARDTKLERDVALKLLPRALADAPDRRARLLREARAAASLNDANICTIHDVGEADGRAYIAMEVVEGQPLSTRIAAGSLAAEDVVRYGVQLADALAHAHERGIVHRDLKSANVMVSPEGRIKVLDFGLAKVLGGDDLTLEHQPAGVWLDPAIMASAYGGVGDMDRALEWTERGLTERATNMIYMKVAPTWDFGRSDPRFQALLRRMNFP